MVNIYTTAQNIKHQSPNKHSIKTKTKSELNKNKKIKLFFVNWIRTKTKITVKTKSEQKIQLIHIRNELELKL